MSNIALVLAPENLAQRPHKELVGLVEQLRGILRAKDAELLHAREVFADMVDQRDAALSLNELCHY